MHRPTDYRTFTVEDSAIVLVDHQAGTIGWAGELASQDERDRSRCGSSRWCASPRARGWRRTASAARRTSSKDRYCPNSKKFCPRNITRAANARAVINAWDDLAFTDVVRATGKTNLVMAGVTTDVCLVPPALSAKAEGFEVVALLDISAATTKTGGRNSRDLLQAADIALLSVAPMITSMLGDFTNPAAAGLYEAMGAEGVFDAFAQGNLR